jgi:hypothetical protein
MRSSAEKRRHSRRTNPTRSEWRGRSLRPFATERRHETDAAAWQPCCGGSRSSSVLAAYGWPADIDREGLLARLLALNLARAEES